MEIFKLDVRARSSSKDNEEELSIKQNLQPSQSITEIFKIANERFIKKNAEGTGVEPVRAYAHEFSRLAHYRPAHPPLRRVPESNRRNRCFADIRVSSSPTRLFLYFILIYID